MNWLWSWLSGWFGGVSPGDRVAAIQAMVVKLCSFLPMAETVVAIMGTGGLAAAPVLVVAKQICAVVTTHAVTTEESLVMTLTSSDVPPPVVVVGQLNGVPITGVFVK